MFNLIILKCSSYYSLVLSTVYFGKTPKTYGDSVNFWYYKPSIVFNLYFILLNKDINKCMFLTIFSCL